MISHPSQPDVNIPEALKNIENSIKVALQETNQNHNVRVIAASKTKTIEHLKQVYDCGVRDFGENYVEEMVEKAPHVNFI